jgi:hypothetical protein
MNNIHLGNTQEVGSLQTLIMYGILNLWVPDEQVIAAAATELVKILDPHKKCLDEPLVIICWDESHLLTNQIDGESWTRLSELRRALRKIRDSVFLSTAAQFHPLPPDIEFGPSNRLTYHVLHQFSPITEVGFDQFAAKVSPNGESTLTQVSSTDHMAHLCRALWV